MPADTNTVLYDVEDFKVFPVATDTTAASPTFGTAVDVPGVSGFSLDPNVVSGELKGDGGKLIAFKSRMDRFNFSATYGKLDVDVLEVITGQTATTAADDQYINLDTDEMPTFRAVAQVLDTDEDVGDVWVDLYVCRLSGSSLIGQSTDSFGQPTMDATAFKPQHASSPIGRITLHDAATTIS